MEKFNENIKLVKIVDKPIKLKKDEYYALMVTDLYNRHLRPDSDYWNYSRGYLGLERTSEHKIYISKDFYKRKNLGRGLTFVIKVKSKKECCKLDH